MAQKLTRFVTYLCVGVAISIVLFVLAGCRMAPFDMTASIQAVEGDNGESSPLPTYAITYYANGGTGAVPTDAGSYYDGQAITIAGQGGLTNGGDSFAGWNTVPGGGGTAYAPGSNTMPAGALDLYAQWSAVPTYTVTFDSNGGSPVASEIVPDGGLVTEPADPVRAGYTFGGWYTDLGFTTLWDFATDAVTADVTLYAQWTANSYGIIYNANGGTGTMANQPVTFGDTVTLNPNTFTRTGYRFMGWADTSGGAVIWADADSYLHDIDVDRTQYAVWEQEYTVTYSSLDADGGIAPADANVYLAGETVTVLGNTGTLVRTGYTFGGWTDGVTNYVAGNTFVMPSNNVTLDPIWEPEFAGGDGSSGSPYQVATATHLNNVRNHLGASFVQTANIDLGVSPYNTGSGFEPIGDSSTKFVGSFDGNGFTISNLYIDRNATGVGLFGQVEAATITSVRLESVDIYNGGNNTGGIVGGSVVSGTSITDSYVTGTISSAGYNIGSVVGYGTGLSVSNTFGDATVSTTSGFTNGGVGGLIGRINSGGTIHNTYFVGSVTGTTDNAVGGLIGSNSATVTDSYAAATITAPGSTVGGLIGTGGTVTDSFYDEVVSTMSDTGKGTPYTTAEMRTSANFSGIWDFTSTWEMVDATSYPYFQTQPSGIGARP